jgi:exonuclease III
LIGHSDKNKINEEILDLNDTIDQMDLTDIYKVLHLKTAQYTFFYTAHGTISKIDKILGHKTSLKKFKKIEIIHCNLSDHNAVKLELKKKSSRKRCINN